MAKLTGQTIADSYDQLLIVDNASGVRASLQAIEAGDTGGSASSLKISTSKCEVIPASNSTSLLKYHKLMVLLYLVLIQQMQGSVLVLLTQMNCLNYIK